MLNCMPASLMKCMMNEVLLMCLMLSVSKVICDEVYNVERLLQELFQFVSDTFLGLMIPTMV